MNFNAKPKYSYKRSTRCIPNLEFSSCDEKKHRIKTTNQNDPMYSEYICINCCYKKNPVAKKDETNPHFRCIKQCCPLPYHWTLCETCIDIQFKSPPVDDPKRKSDADKFRLTFSKLPDDIKRVIGEYLPVAFSFIDESNKTMLSIDSLRIRRSPSYKMDPNIIAADILRGDVLCASKIFSQFLDQPIKIWNLVYAQLLLTLPSYWDNNEVRNDKKNWKVGSDSGSRVLRPNNKVDICEKVTQLLCEICDVNLSYTIREDDFWKYPKGNLQFLLKKVVSMNRIIQIMRTGRNEDIRDHFTQIFAK